MKFFLLLLVMVMACSAQSDRRRALIISRNAVTPWTDDPGNYPEGMKQWLKADNLITNDGAGALSGWGDSSGNQNHAVQATGSAQPTVVTNAYGLGNTVRFDGTADVMTCPRVVVGASAQFWTIMFIGRVRTGIDDSATIGFSGVNNQPLRLTLAATNSIGFFNGNTYESSFGGALSNGCRFVVTRMTNLLYEIRNNSISNSVAIPGIETASYDQVGAYSTFAVFANVDISELIVWTNRALTEPQLNSLYTNYAIKKYSIALP